MQSIEEKLTTRWYREHSHELHKQRLQEIKSHASKRIDNSLPRTIEGKTHKKQGKDFRKKEKKKSINKDNEQMLKVLEEITTGKRETTTQKILKSAREVPAVKSLNINVRKKEARRIDEDNEAMFKRLHDRTTELSAQRFKDEWEVINRYRVSISKRGYRHGSNFTSRLPPMEEVENRENKEEEFSKTINQGHLPKIKKVRKRMSLDSKENGLQESWLSKLKSEPGKDLALADIKLEDKKQEIKVEIKLEDQKKQEIKEDSYELPKDKNEGVKENKESAEKKHPEEDFAENSEGCLKDEKETTHLNSEFNTIEDKKNPAEDRKNSLSLVAEIQFDAGKKEPSELSELNEFKVDDSKEGEFEKSSKNSADESEDKKSESSNEGKSESRSQSKSSSKKSESSSKKSESSSKKSESRKSIKSNSSI